MRAVQARRSIGIDTVSYVTPHAERLKRILGERATIFRYLNHSESYRQTPDPSDDWLKSLSMQELRELLDLGFRVGLVQVGIGRRHRGGAEMGRKVGEAAVHNAVGIGAPDAVHIFCDCEWAESIVPPKAEQVEYIEAWGAAVWDGGFIPGLYVSPDLALNCGELYGLRHIRAYWKSASWAPTVNTRGYMIVQSTENYFYESEGCHCVAPYSDEIARTHRGGLRFDYDMICADGKAAGSGGATGVLRVIGA
jgi:hypothetical protein